MFVNLFIVSSPFVYSLIFVLLSTIIIFSFLIACKRPLSIKRPQNPDREPQLFRSRPAADWETTTRSESDLISPVSE